ncbi:MAG: alanine racemase [Candidatus Heimdallarchaeota archaeon]
MFIEQPSLVINEERAKKNIKKMAEKAKKSKVFFRPHCKTHQSATVGEWLREEGVTAITVSSVDMAEYFAENGWTDITIAFPVNMRQLERINKLAEKIELGLLIESQEIIPYLEEKIKTEVNIWIKIDTAYHRTGIAWDDPVYVTHIVRDLKETTNLSFEGLLVHAGHSYYAKSEDEIRDIYFDTAFKLKDLQEKLFLQGFSQVKLSIGDTPTCSIVEEFYDVDEVRPGNFVYNDITQVELGACKEEDVAVAVACPVVAIHKERNEIVVYGGGVHLSKEFLMIDENTKSYGRVALQTEDGWGPSLKDTYVKFISQEHGIIKTTPEVIKNVTLEDSFYILPIHSCMTANLLRGHQVTVKGKDVDSIPL